MSLPWSTKSSPERIAPPASKSLRKAGIVAFVWVVVFDLAHVYWACGGKLGFGNEPESAIEPPVNSLGSWIFVVITGGMFLIGTIVPLALYQDWGRRVPAWMLSWCCWIAAVILLLRGVSAWIDTALRGTGLVRNGLTGLTYKQETGLAHPSLYTLCSTSAIDSYFAIGGAIFLVVAITHRRSRRGAAVESAAAVRGTVAHDAA
jgi:hypothetical protein